MAQLYTEQIPQPEHLSYPEIQDHIASLGLLFDSIIEQGNSSYKGAVLNTNRLLIGPFYDSNDASIRSLQGIVFTEDGDIEGKMVFTGHRSNESEAFSWQLTKAPVSITEPTEAALHLAEQYVVPIARIWQALPQGAQELYLGQHRETREKASRYNTLRSMARFITRLGKV